MSNHTNHKKTFNIAMLSFADIDNFGDILFSDVFESEIIQRIPNASIDFYTPTEFICNGRVYRSLVDAHNFTGYDAVVLAGGEVIHFYDERTWLPVYRKKNKNLCKDFKPSDIVWTIPDSKAKFKAWLSVGVRPCEEMGTEKVMEAINKLDYVSVRGILSKKILEGGISESYNKNIKVTPDLGWLFPKLIEGKTYKKMQKFSKDNYVLFQANNISESECELISYQLLRVQEELGVNVLLLPIIKPWEDYKYLDIISEKSEGRLKVLRNDMEVFDMIDVIINARAVLSGSLHCAITALAASVPAGIVNKWQGTKLQDLFSQQFRLDVVTSNYTEVFDIYQKLLTEYKNSRHHLQLTADFMRLHLQRTFDELVKEIIS